jgi:tRNA(adenine34) deaminase
MKPLRARALMRRAVALSKLAQQAGDVPVGALVVNREGTEVIAEAFNKRESSQCATQHAEVAAIQEACKSVGSWRLDECSLIVTLEPCIMCAGAIIHSRIDSVIFGAHNPNNGGFGSLYSLHEDQRLNHAVSVVGGVEQELCRHQLNAFFAERRESSKERKEKARSSGLPICVE